MSDVQQKQPAEATATSSTPASQTTNSGRSDVRSTAIKQESAPDQPMDTQPVLPTLTLADDDIDD